MEQFGQDCGGAARGPRERRRTAAFSLARVQHKKWEQIFLDKMHGCAILFCWMRQRAGGVGVPGTHNRDWEMWGLLREIIYR